MHLMQRSSESGGASAPAAPPSVHATLASTGQPLEASMRATMESHFGADFAGVQVHTDPSAAASARDVDARAYTVGSHLVFGAGQYAPDTTGGRRLIAHELAHVVQQDGSAVRLQRDPPKPTPTPTPTPTPPALAPAVAPKNQAEADAQTSLAYPKDADLEKAFKRFEGIPEISNITVPTERRAFLARMSLYLGPAPAAENHFAKIKKAKFGRDPQWAHEKVLDRLNAVRDELKTKGHAMPESGATFSLRGRDLGPVQPRGLMVHALGLALDYRAETNVHIKDPRLVDLQSIFVREAMRIDVGKWTDRRATILKMGQGTATAAEIKAFDEKFHSQFEAAALGSKAMQAILSTEDVAKVAELSDRYRALKKRMADIAAREKKIPERERSGIKYWGDKAGFYEGGSPQWESLQVERRFAEQERTSIATGTSTLMDPLKKKVQDEMDDYLKKHPELSGLPDAAELESEHTRFATEFKSAETAMKKAKAVMDRATKTVSAANAALVKAGDAVVQAEERGSPTARLQGLADAARQKAQDATDAAFVAEHAFAEATAAFDAARAERDKWEGKYAFIGQERWFERLRNLRDSLVSDLDFVLIGKRTVEDPSIAQLLQKGYFNPDEPGKGGFDEEFMKTMAHHGFDQGAEWEPGGVDSMHFELTDAVESLLQPADAKVKK